MKAILTMLATALLTVSVQAQTTYNAAQDGKSGTTDTSVSAAGNQSSTIIGREVVSVGVGSGFEYCGFGTGVTIYPQKNIGLLANVGVSLAGPSYLVGLKARHISKTKNIDPYLILTYGYSGGAVVFDQDGHIYKYEIFIKTNIGAGIDIHFKSNILLSAGLITNTAVSENREFLDENDSKAVIPPLPIGWTVGIKWRIR